MCCSNVLALRLSDGSVLDQNGGVTSGCAEVVHKHSSLPIVLLERSLLECNVHIPFGEIWEAFVHFLLDPDMRRDGTLPHDQQRLDQGSHAGYSLSVANVCLDRSEVQLLVRLALSI